MGTNWRWAMGLGLAGVLLLVPVMGNAALSLPAIDGLALYYDDVPDVTWLGQTLEEAARHPDGRLLDPADRAENFHLIVPPASSYVAQEILWVQLQALQDRRQMLGDRSPLVLPGCAPVPDNGST
jgi:hypothetical protein